MPSPKTYRDPAPAAMPDWVKRCDRAHVNVVESLAPFAALVPVAHAEASPTGRRRSGP